MKKMILAFWLAIGFYTSYAQKSTVVTPYTVPVDSITKLITYTGVIDVGGTSADILYKRINDWFHTYYKNPTEAIRDNDSIKFIITGKPRFRLADIAAKDGTKKEGGIIQYTITVAARSGRFRYELTEFNWKQASNYPCEKWLDVKATTYLPVFNDYLQQLDMNAKDVVNSLKNAATHEKGVKDKDKW